MSAHRKGLLDALDCRDPASKCEDQFLWAGKGTCNVTTGICLCPEGTSGRDDWGAGAGTGASYNDCRVNESAQLVIWMISLVLGAFSLIIAIYGFVYLLIHWNVADRSIRRISKLTSSPSWRLKRSGSKASRKSFAPDGKVVAGEARVEAENPMAESRGRDQEDLDDDMHGAEMARRMSSIYTSFNSDDDDTEAGHEELGESARLPSRREAAARKFERRKRYTFLVLFSFICYALGMVVYFANFVAGNFRFDLVLVQDLALVIATVAIFTGLWLFFLIWWTELPSLRLYGKLFGIDSIIIRKPDIVEFLTKVRFATVFVVTFTLLFGWTYIIDEARGLSYEEKLVNRNLLDTLFLMFCSLVVLDFWAFSLVLILILRRIFVKLYELSVEAVARGFTSGKEQQTFKRAQNTINILVVLLCTIGPFVTATFLMTAFFAAFRGRVHVTLNICIGVGNCVVLIVVWLFVYRLAGARVQGSFRKSNDSNKSRDTDSQPDVDRIEVSHMNL